MDKKKTNDGDLKSDVPYPKMVMFPRALCLSNLYQTVALRSAVRLFLDSIFETKFKHVMLEAKQKHFVYHQEASTKKVLIKNIFIEYGLPLESVEDLKLILATLPEFNDLRKEFKNVNFANLVYADANGTPLIDDSNKEFGGSEPKTKSNKNRMSENELIGSMEEGEEADENENRNDSEKKIEISS